MLICYTFSFMATTKVHRKKSCNRRKKCGNKTIRKYKGGVTFNSTIGDSSAYTYVLDKYDVQPDRAPLLFDSRLQTGLPYQVAGKRAHKKRSAKRRKMKGGVSLLLGSTENTNAPLAFGTTSGAQWMTNEIGAVKQPIGAYLGSGRVQSNLV